MIATATTATIGQRRALQSYLARAARARGTAPYYRMLRGRAAFPGTEREQLAARIGAQLDRQHAARVLEEQRVERAAVRAARGDRAAASGSATLADAATGRLPDVEQLAARRRDQYRAALSYPMTAEEVLLAVDQALSDARLPDDDDRSETLAALTLHVYSRHGMAPLRCDVGREWLRVRALRIHESIAIKRERATGMRASAGLLRKWQAERARDDQNSGDDSGPDGIWHVAAGLPAPVDSGPPLSADQLAARLQLTDKQRDALVRSLEYQQRVTAAMSAAENMAAERARVTLRKRYPDPDALRCALRPMYGAQLAVERCIGIMRHRASVAGSRGTLLPGRSLSMAEQLRPILRANDQRLTRADRVWTYGLTARDDRAARR